MCFIGVSMCGPIHFLPPLSVLSVSHDKYKSKSVCDCISLINGTIRFILDFYLSEMYFLFSRKDAHYATGYFLRM